VADSASHHGYGHRQDHHAGINALVSGWRWLTAYMMPTWRHCHVTLHLLVKGINALKNRPAYARAYMATLANLPTPVPT